MYMGFPGGTSGKECTHQYKRVKRLGFNSSVGKISWSRKWQLTRVFSPGKPHGQRSLAGSSPRCLKESDMTENAHNTCAHTPNMCAHTHACSMCVYIHIYIYVV